MHFLSNEEKEKWIKDYVQRDTVRARKRVEDAEATGQREKDEMTQAEIAGLRSTEPEKTFEEMLVPLRDSLSDLASSDDGEDGEDEDDEETEQGKLSEDDEPSCVVGTMAKTVQQHIETFRQKQMKLNVLTQPGWKNAADYFRERDKKYGKSKLSVPTVIQPQTNDDALAPPSTAFGQCIESLDIVRRISQRLQWTSRLGCSHIRLGSVKPQLKSSIPSGKAAVELNSSTLLNVNQVEPEMFHPCL